MARPPKNRVTIRDVARACEVDISTVSRILNNRFENFSASPVKLEMVRSTAKRLGYRPNRLAQSLRSQRSSFIGLSFPSLPEHELAQNLSPSAQENYFLSENLLWGLVHCCQLRNYALVMLPRKESTAETLAEHDIVPEIVAGTIYLMPTIVHTEYQQASRRMNNIVLMGRCPAGSNIPSCDIDNFGEAARLTTQLIQDGVRRPAFLLPAPATYLLSQDRLNGFCAALQQHGLPLRRELIMNDARTMENPGAALEECLREHPDIDGVILGSDCDPESIVAHIRAVGRNHERDLRMGACFWHPWMAQKLRGMLSLRLPYYQMGLGAVDLLIRQIDPECERQPESLSIPCELIRT